MKKKIIVALLVAFIFLKCGYVVYEFVPFFESLYEASAVSGESHITSAPEIKVILRQIEDNDYGNEGDIFYYLLDNKGHCEETEKFKADKDVESFSGGIEELKINGEYTNVIKKFVYDENGNKVEADDITKDILKAVVKKIDHDMMQLSIMHVNDDYYVYTELNVNLWTPCELYKYDTTSKKLKKLHVWDGQEVIGISTDV